MFKTHSNTCIDIQRLFDKDMHRISGEIAEFGLFSQIPHACIALALTRFWALAFFSSLVWFLFTLCHFDYNTIFVWFLLIASKFAAAWLRRMGDLGKH